MKGSRKRRGRFFSRRLATTLQKRDALIRRLERDGFARSNDGIELEALTHLGLSYRSEFTGGTSHVLVGPMPGMKRRVREHYVFGCEGWQPAWSRAVADCVRAATGYPHEARQGKPYIGTLAHLRFLTAAFGLVRQRAEALRDELVGVCTAEGAEAGLAFLASRGLHLRTLDQLHTGHHRMCICHACSVHPEKRHLAVLRRMIRTNVVPPQYVHPSNLATQAKEAA